MIRPIDIKLNAAYPELPLAEASTFVGSPSAVFIRGVPSNCGRWAITAVSVAATYPDNSTTTRAAVQSANGVWVATLPATATSGRTANGIRILADGIDENGAAVSGYILGVADFAVATLGVSPAPSPGETSYQMLYFDEVPSVARKGDVAKIDGVVRYYDGTAWQPFAAKYLFVNVTVEDGVCTLQPFANNQIDYTEWTFSGPLKDNVVTGPTRVDHVWSVGVMIGSMSETITADQTASDASTLSFIGVDGNPVLVATRQPQTFTVAVAASPTGGAMRDLWLVIKAGAEDSPTVTWPANFVPANGDADNLVAEANATTVFLISEYSPDKFIVARQVVEAAS